MQNIDINCDIGEGFGRYILGDMEEIFPYISSCNIACGFHAGDPIKIKETIRRAADNKLRIGAHPSYPDLQGFGRRKMSIPAKDLKAIIQYQLYSIIGFATMFQQEVQYVKPHGALYNTAAQSPDEAKIIIESILEISSKLKLMGLASSKMESIALEMGIDFIAEAFADRTYQIDKTLVNRNIPDAVISDPKKAANQALQIGLYQRGTAIDGSIIDIKAQSICIHSDSPNAVQTAKAVHQLLIAQGFVISS